MNESDGSPPCISMFSTVEDALYWGGYSLLLWGVVSWKLYGNILRTVRIFSTVEGYKVILCTMGNMLRTMEDILRIMLEVQFHGGISCHMCGDIISTMGDVHYPTFLWYPPQYWTSPTILKISPRVLKISLHSTQGISPQYWTLPGYLAQPTVLNTH